MLQWHFETFIPVSNRYKRHK